MPHRPPYGALVGVRFESDEQHGARMERVSGTPRQQELLARPSGEPGELDLDTETGGGGRGQDEEVGTNLCGRVRGEGHLHEALLTGEVQNGPLSEP